MQLNNTNCHIKVVSKQYGFKFQITLSAAFREKLNNYQMTNYSKSNAELIFNDLNVDEGPKLSSQVIMSRIQKWLGKGFQWLIGSVDVHYINNSNFKLFGGSSYIELPDELKS